MAKIDLKTALSLERYMDLGPDCADAAKRKAEEWMQEEEAGFPVFEDGVQEVVERIIAAPQK